MRRLALAATALAVLAGTLAGCGNAMDDYCGVIKEHRKELNAMVEAGTQYGLITHLPMLQQMSDAAPEDLADEWQVFLGAVKGLADAVDATGHEPGDFADGHVPGDLTPDQAAALTAAANRLTSEDTVAASSGIDQQARDVCKVNLGR